MNQHSGEILGVIPARLQASRLAGKPLRIIAGKSLVRRVWEQAQKSKRLTHLVVATDSEEIAAEVRKFDGQAVLTSESIQTGSERVAVAARMLAEGHWDVIVNIQGDMPFITGAIIDQTINFLLQAPDQYSMATVAVPIFSQEIYLSPSTVKVVFNDAYEALYFSRSPIPYLHEPQAHESQAIGVSRDPAHFYGYQHLGLYAFFPPTLRYLLATPQSLLEKREGLEQLRLLSGGQRIGVYIPTEYHDSLAVEVNTPEDLKKAEELIAKFD